MSIAPIPWLPAPVISFLDDKLTGLRIFEWGSGGSTLWLAERCKQITSIEHDSQWYASVLASKSSGFNMQLCLLPLGPSYWMAIHTWPSDFVLIDGRHRKACAEQVKLCSNPPAAVLWDDAQRDYYQCSMQFDGYQHRDFPDPDHPRTSRLFVRPDGLLASWLQ